MAAGHRVIPTDVAGLCDELATLYRQLGDAITPAPSLDKSLARDTTSRWCVMHRHYVPFGPVDIHRHVLGTPPTLAAAVMPTARPDNGARRGVPGSRPPLSGPALDALVAQEGIEIWAPQLANDLRAALGHETRHRHPLGALAVTADLVEALPREHPDRRRIPSVLWSLRQRARDVLGLSRDVMWLGPCPCTFDTALVGVTRVDGELVEFDSVGCWTMDFGAMVADGGGREIWRRSRLAMLRDEDRPRVVCFACWYEPTDAEMARLALDHLVGTAGG